MIELDLVTYLLTDATLKTLLGWVATDDKIYPIQAPEGIVVPYLLYDWGTGDTTDEILDEDRVQITIVDTNLANAIDIRDRIKLLLDKQDGIQSTTFSTTSANYFIYYSKMTGGTAIVDAEGKEYNLILYFNVKHKNKNP